MFFNMDVMVRRMEKTVRHTLEFLWKHQRQESSLQHSLLAIPHGRCHICVPQRLLCAIIVRPLIHFSCVSVAVAVLA